MNRTAPVDFVTPTTLKKAPANGTNGHAVVEAPPPLTAGALVRLMIGEKPLRRLKTGLPMLDVITRGGIPEAKVVIVGGAPGAGKTTQATQAAFDAAVAGWAVMIYVTDGSIEEVLQRCAQLDGFTRDEFDAREPEALARIADRLDAIGLWIVDSEQCRMIEDASEALVKLRGSRPSMLVVDSVQTSMSRGGEFADGPRARIDANMKALKYAARVDRHMVIGPSELARGSYRSKDASEQINDLASFKESGGVEYAADLAVVLRSVRGEDDLVDVSVAKSRLGARTPFRLQLDRRHMRFREVEMPSEEDGERAKAAAVSMQAANDARVVERFLVENPGVHGITGLRTALRAAGIALSNPRIDVAVKRLGDRVEVRGVSNRPLWYLRAPAEGGSTC
jgi:DnaB-like helicase C terminal domain